MQIFRHILFVSQGVHDTLGSLDLATQFSEALDTTLEGLIICPTLPHYLTNYTKIYEQSLRYAVDSHLNLLVKQNRRATRFPLTLNCGLKPIPYILRHIRKNETDLVIKDVEPSGQIEQGFKPLDVDLLRQCPCSVWLHRTTEKRLTEQNVAFAIDPNITSETQQAFVLYQLSVARALVKYFDMRVHIIACWENHIEHQTGIKLSSQKRQRDIERIRMTQRTLITHLLEALGMSDNVLLHYLYGQVDEVIPNIVTDMCIDVLVIGSVRKSKCAGKVTGKTTENILQSVSCSLLTLKRPMLKFPTDLLTRHRP